MTIKTVVLAAPAAILATVLASCHHGELASPAAAAPPPPPLFVLAPEASAEPFVHAVDPAEALLHAARTLQLSDMQRAFVNRLRDRLSPYARSARAALEDLREDVAQQVRAGAILPASVHEDEDRAAGALTIAVDEEAQAINALYAVLDPEQRTAVVAAVRATLPGLTEAQRPEASRRDPLVEEQQRRVDAVLSGFAGSYFDAWTTVPAPLVPPADALRQRIDGEIAWLEKMLPTLQPEERDRLASAILARPVAPVPAGSE